MTLRYRRSGAVFAGLALSALAMSACGSSTGDSAGASTKIKVVTSTDVWGSVVRAVGGDQVEVTSIITSPSADPHSYESAPADAAALNNAKLAVYNGGGYDDFFPKLLESSGKDARKIVAVDLAETAEAGAAGETSTSTADTHDSHEAHEPADSHEAHEPHESGAGETSAADTEHGHDEHGHDHGAGNEHVWYDLPTVKKVADKAAEELGAVKPEAKDTFAANAKDFGAKIDEVLAKAERIGAGHPNTKVLATEPVAAYLLDSAGLVDATPEEFSEAIEEETDPPAAAIAQVNDMVSTKQVAVLVNNAQTESPVTTQLNDKAKAAGLPIVDVTESLPEGVTDYVVWMNKQVDALSEAVAKQ